MKTISTDDLTFVIQGPLAGVDSCVSSIHKYFPGAPIVVSTWRDESIEGLNVDQIILSDPLVPFLDFNERNNYIASQVLSTSMGLAAVKTEFAVKVRADHFFENGNLINIIEEMVRCGGECLSSKSKYSLLHNKIGMSDLISRDPTKVPLLFHPSDLIHFGYTKDLIDLWCGDSIEEGDAMFPVVQRRLFGNLLGYSRMKHVPEQTLMIRWLDKHGVYVELPYAGFSSYSMFRISESYISYNFMIISWKDLGLRYPPQIFNASYSKHSGYQQSTLDKLIRRSGNRYFSFFRYSQVLIAKYITCWLKPIFIYSCINMILFRISPSLALKVRRNLKKSRNLSHPRGSR
ncbi:MAG: WavE lipopolysaccharide synthesis family protein [Saccharospirillaceae bacterium]|nr:hypothetical protein A3759_17650 [Thalassolituus sp. HI0120]MCH2039332.1 WavE lipopolysaccharide synthesis family protein [Saccharospirillaceae bacterium]